MSPIHLKETDFRAFSFDEEHLLMVSKSIGMVIENPSQPPFSKGRHFPSLEKRGQRRFPTTCSNYYEIIK
jgi:hypothetical protein